MQVKNTKKKEQEGLLFPPSYAIDKIANSKALVEV